MTYEEKEKLEQIFKYALDNIVSKIEGKTATEIVVCEQSMILLFQQLMITIETQNIRIQKLKKENEKMYNLVMKYLNKEIGDK